MLVVVAMLIPRKNYEHIGTYTMQEMSEMCVCCCFTQTRVADSDGLVGF